MPGTQRDREVWLFPKCRESVPEVSAPVFLKCRVTVPEGSRAVPNMSKAWIKGLFYPLT